jgi:hypothetical protein
MDCARILRLADTVAQNQFPRVNLKTTVYITVPGEDIPHEIKVWVVDGEYLRTYVDTEFNNFGQHYRFNYIPMFEFWLDGENISDESEFFIEHLKVEWALMRAGKSYSDAIVEADNVERDLRRKTDDFSKVVDPVRRLIDSKLFRVKLLKSLGNGLNVWLVDGRLVRSVLNIDFCQGGHPLVYEFVPPGEIWIDNDANWTERGYIILHEIHELNRMEEGLSYETAHAESAILENRCRNNPDELHDALIAEGWA